MSIKARQRQHPGCIKHDRLWEYIHRMVLGTHSCLNNLGNNWRLLTAGILGRTLDASNNNHGIYQYEDSGIDFLAEKHLQEVSAGTPGKSIFLALGFVNLVIGLGGLDNVVKFGAYDGTLSAHLARLQYTVYFHALDIVPGIEAL